MQRLLATLTVCLLLFCSNYSFAQVADTGRLAKADTTQASVAPSSSYSATDPNDDDFTAVLIMGMSIFLAVMAGAVIVGAGLTLLLAALIAAFITTGIISASLLAAFYTRSIKAGFKTLIIIIAAILGAIIGMAGLFMAVKIFHLHISNQTALLTGSLGGLGGGILTGFIIYRAIVYTLQYARKKLKLA